MPDITVNHVRLVYEAHGDPALPPLIMIHGLYGNRHLGSTIDLFTDQRHVIAYDVRGHGDSDKPAHYTLADHGHDLVSLIDEFKAIRKARMDTLQRNDPSGGPQR